MMILANGLAADFASLNSLPVIYRTQEPREAIEVDDAPQMEALTFEKLRKTFKRSRLSLTPGVHSGLGLGAYTQASSPIRRYADSITQRQFTAMLRGVRYHTGARSCCRSSQLQRASSRRFARLKTVPPITGCSNTSHGTKKIRNSVPPRSTAKDNIELEDYYLRAKLSSPPETATRADDRCTN